MMIGVLEKMNQDRKKKIIILLMNLLKKYILIVKNKVKFCISCERPFEWRKKWERDWENVNIVQRNALRIVELSESKIRFYFSNFQMYF